MAGLVVLWIGFGVLGGRWDTFINGNCCDSNTN